MRIVEEKEFTCEVSDYPIFIKRITYADEDNAIGKITEVDIPFTDSDIENLPVVDAENIVIEIFKFSDSLYAGMKLLEIPMTRTLAKVLCKTNMKNNRNMTKKNFEQIKDAVETNKFKSAGDPVKIRKDGNLGDGNHRINAIAASDASSESEVPILQLLFGITNEQLKYVDIGRSRSMSDRMQMLGVLEGGSVAKVSGNIYKISSMAMSYVYYFYENTQSFLKAVSHVNKDRVEQLASIMEDNKDLCIESAKFGSKHNKEWGNVSVLAFCYFMIVDSDGELGREFFARLHDKVGLPINSPITYTCKRLTSNKTAGGITEERRRHNIMHFIFQAFKAFKEGRCRKIYRWAKTEAETRDVIVSCI